MKSAQIPVRAPERFPEPNTQPRANWPRPVKKPSRFIIKISTAIPS